MIVVPEDVKQSYEEKSKGFRCLKAGMRNNGFDEKAYNNGFRIGKEAMAQRSIEV